MSRVLLVNAHWGGLFSGTVRRYNRRFVPLGLLNAASLLRADGAEVTLWDARVYPERRVGLRSAYDHIFVTLSSLDRWQCPNTDLDAMDRFLEAFPRDRLVLLGAQPTVQPDALLRRTGARAVIVGEPEAIIQNMVAAPDAWSGMTGVATLEDDALVVGPATPGLDLEQLPVPAFDLIDFQDYRYEVLGGNMGVLELTRGCPWRCNFCLLAMYGKQYRRKRIDQMLREIRSAMTQGMECVYFHDLEFTLDHQLVTVFCEALLTEGIALRWTCQTRPDTVTQPLLALMKEAGCELIHFGVESGSESVLATTNKRQTLAAVEQAVGWAHELGMRTLCFFLLGLPGETRADMDATLAFARKLGPTYASFQAATPYPMTPYHEAGGFTEPFPTSFPGPLDTDALRALARSFTMAYHLRPGYLMDRLRSTGTREAGREIGLMARYLFA